MSADLLRRPPRAITFILVEDDAIAIYEGDPPLIGESIALFDQGGPAPAGALEPGSAPTILRVTARGLRLITAPDRDLDAYWMCQCEIEDR